MKFELKNTPVKRDKTKKKSLEYKMERKLNRNKVYGKKTLVKPEISTRQIGQHSIDEAHLAQVTTCLHGSNSVLIFASRQMTHWLEEDESDENVDADVVATSSVPSSVSSSTMRC